MGGWGCAVFSHSHDLRIKFGAVLLEIPWLVDETENLTYWDVGHEILPIQMGIISSDL